MEREMMRRRWRLGVFWDWWFVVVGVGGSGGGIMIVNVWLQIEKHRLIHAGGQIPARFLVALHDSQKSKESDINFL